MTSKSLAYVAAAIGSIGLASFPLKASAQVGANAPVPGGDQAFVQKASQAGAAEVAMGNLAAANASSGEVKAFAARMVSDHSDANAKLHAIAQGQRISAPDQPTAKDAAEIHRLDSLNGRPFDAEYIKVQRKAHEDAVALFKKEANSGKDPALKSFAEQTLPTLQDHLRMVTALATPH
jgi:putative membrane protein